ncbi:hypothetical protein [Streptomyces sp. NBC_01465]|uniref:hypothetical protein n=1 Tax=Streptomyces sp. NBC_01465 TaxID=2903878 RepID=UPI002E2F3673|nr:hypothetical protein [Streptomyces sp. NBC_01465]
MSHRPIHAECVESGPAPLTVPEATVVVIVVVLAAILALAGLPSLSALVLIVEAATTGVKLARRLFQPKAAAQEVS